MAGFSAALEQVVMEQLLHDNLPAPYYGGLGTLGASVLFLVAFFVLIGLGFIGHGAYLWLNVHTTPDMAALLTGLLSLLFAALILGGTAYALKVRHEKNKAYRQSIARKMQASLKETLDVINDEFGEPIRAHPMAAILLALLTGYTLQDRIL